MKELKYPKFFDEIENITVQDELAKFLGVNEDGIVEYTYLDLVKSTGHSCATVAGAYLITMKGLKALYKDKIPERGKIKVELKRVPTENNAGVVATVVSTITGATSNFGFGGLPTGQFNRRNLLFFNVPMDVDVRLTRLDNSLSVGVNYRPKRVADPESMVRKMINPDASEEYKRNFPVEFQKMVEKIMKNPDKVIDIIYF